MEDDFERYYFLEEHISGFRAMARSYKERSLSLLKYHFTEKITYSEHNLLLLCEVLSACAALDAYSEELFPAGTAQDGRYELDALSLEAFTRVIKMLIESERTLRSSNIVLEDQ